MLANLKITPRRPCKEEEEVISTNILFHPVNDLSYW